MKNFPIRPIGDKVAIKRDEHPEESRGGILIPDVAKKKRPDGGVVVAARAKYLKDGREHDNPVKVGDRVLFPAYQGTEVEVEGETFLLLSVGEIMAVVDQ